jgi:hypothetical protein
MGRQLIVGGNTFTHMINGRLMTVVVDDDAPNRPADGPIGMQVHAGPPMSGIPEYSIKELVKRRTR